ncbi:MAG: ATP synthase F1 subunit delta [Terriglobia bacterium]
MPMAVAYRYARALVEAAGPKADYSALRGALGDFAAVYAESAELREAFDSPAVAPHQKSGLLDAILDRLQTPELARNFLRVLLAHYRLNLLDDIMAAYQELVNERLGVVRMTVASALPLSEEQQRLLRESFGKLTGQKVDIQYQVDPELLGGARAQIRSTVYDGSVRGYLDRIREQLEAGSAA